MSCVIQAVLSNNTACRLTSCVIFKLCYPITQLACKWAVLFLGGNLNLKPNLKLNLSISRHTPKVAVFKWTNDLSRIKRLKVSSCTENIRFPSNNFKVHYTTIAVWAIVQTVRYIYESMVGKPIVFNIWHSHFLILAPLLFPELSIYWIVV